MSSNIDTALYTDASCVKRGLRVIIEEERFEATKGVTNNHKSKKKDSQYNGQKKKDKWTNNDLHNTTQETKDRATRTPQNTGGELRCSRKVGCTCSTSDTRSVLLKLVFNLLPF